MFANLMFYAWKEHHKTPSEVYNMSDGDLKIIKAFHIIENEHRHIYK